MSASHAGRPSSWLVVALGLIGFTIGGVALCIGPNWVLFGVGVAVTVVSGVLGLAVGIMSDVVLDKPRAVSGGTPAAKSGS
ncbi:MULTISPECIES: HGxxPAAW family protein [Thermomonospora]|uniref:Uncharacterized protein n=1 Tax=Thermomonospora curvata (strain ATCC 19995 / DSM 43183 / JCM 3096 / KCTC 9072 / NBRC 15933 / NCIMB 10081 / Henssen B9) TaxID=471852 RepID=D1A236_THECD|nr:MULTISPECIES: HGxxPAAW family protein [Thermomonospora]ACY99689.1 hypothetical protein Tcur_4162 [Thermomonospora curvata DSM 43183]PKK12707.1 MAG: hypothetical protein BUE48_020420 [Thermomonospora sp. CIF 1]